MLEAGLAHLEEHGINLVHVFDLEGLPVEVTAPLRAEGIELRPYRRLVLMASGGPRLWRALEAAGVKVQWSHRASRFVPRRDGVLVTMDKLVAEPMGFRVEFNPGPVVDRPVRTRADIQRIRVADPEQEVPYVYETLQIGRAHV